MAKSFLTGDLTNKTPGGTLSGDKSMQPKGGDVNDGATRDGIGSAPPQLGPRKA